MERLAAIFLLLLFVSAFALNISSQALDPEDIEELPCVLCCGAAILPLIVIAFIFNDPDKEFLP